MREFISKSAKQTKQFAKQFVKQLKKGDVVLLDGPMGAGKTTFVQGLGEGLNIKNKIISPTFNILKIYKSSPLSLYHLDCYRLENIKSDNGLDIYDLLQTDDAIFCIEWSEFLYDDLQYIKNPITVKVDVLNDEERKIVIYD